MAVHAHYRATAPLSPFNTLSLSAEIVEYAPKTLQVWKIFWGGGGDGKPLDPLSRISPLASYFLLNGHSHNSS